MGRGAPRSIAAHDPVVALAAGGVVPGRSQSVISKRIDWVDRPNPPHFNDYLLASDHSPWSND
jgi:hypothetical protein